MTGATVCEERHKVINIFLRYIIAGLISAFLAIGGLYLYAGEKFATKGEISLIRQEIRDGFTRIEKRLP